MVWDERIEENPSEHKIMSKITPAHNRSLLFPISLLVVFFITLGVSWEVNSQTGSKVPASDSVGTIDTTAIGEMPIKPPEVEIKLRSSEDKKLKRVVTNRAFGVGERLVFSVGWEFVNAGTAVMEIPEIIKLDGKRCYHIVSTAKSNKVFSVFFEVDDRVESFMDVYGLYSLRYDKHLREGKFKADVSMVFDQENHLAIYEAGKDTFEVQEYAQDVLSAFYFVRTQELTVGRSLFVPNHADKKNYPLEVRVIRKEKIKVKAGEFDCLVVEPILQTPGIFEQKGSLTVWLTDDAVKMPVLMKSKVVIGSIVTELVSYQLGEVGKI
jgi:hypothetical protein